MKQTYLPRRFRTIVAIGVAVGAMFLVVLFSKNTNVSQVTDDNIPLPFGLETAEGLAGQLVTLGQKRGVTVRNVSFDNGEVSEILRGAELLDSMDFILTPDHATISHGARLCDAVTAGKKYFGYKYTSRAATLEKDRHDAALAGAPSSFPILFPGEFFVSAEQRADTSVMDIPAFEAEKNMTFGDSCTITLDRNARYVIKVMDTNVTFTARGLVVEPLAVCGDGQLHRDKVCEDGNTISGDGCNATCSLVDDILLSIETLPLPAVGSAGIGDMIPLVKFSVTAHKSMALRRLVFALDTGTLEPTADIAFFLATGTAQGSFNMRGMHDCDNYTGIIDCRELAFTAGGMRKDETQYFQLYAVSISEISGVSFKLSSFDAENNVYALHYNKVGEVETYLPLQYIQTNGICEAEACSIDLRTIPSTQWTIGSNTTGVCGDNVVNIASGEQCDDGNQDNADFCDNNCQDGNPIPICGNGLLEYNGADHNPGTADDEQCDDGDTESGDGCSATCTVESGFSCDNATPNVCTQDIICGNGVIESGEACDDGDTDSGDGCSATCQIEQGYICSNDEHEPSVCTLIPVCGNGITEGDEECDDGNQDNTDSCTNTCQHARCGDGIHQPFGADGIEGTADDEECDDGNTDNSDVCDNLCRVLSPF